MAPGGEGTTTQAQSRGRETVTGTAGSPRECLETRHRFFSDIAVNVQEGNTYAGGHVTALRTSVHPARCQTQTWPPDRFFLKPHHTYAYIYTIRALCIKYMCMCMHTGACARRKERSVWHPLRTCPLESTIPEPQSYLQVSATKSMPVLVSHGTQRASV